MSDRHQNLLTLGEVAARAGVSPAAISNWRRRHDDFPHAHSVDGMEMLAEAEIAAWLSQRRIPKNARRAGEPAAHTYGQRFAGDAVPEVTQVMPQRATELTVVDALWRTADQFRGVVKPADLAEISLALLYMKVWQPQRWRELTSSSYLSSAVRSTLRQGPTEAFGFIDRLPREVLEGHVLTELVHVIDRFDLAAAATNARLRCALLTEILGILTADAKSGEHTTPPSVAALMVGLADPQPDERVHDLFGRSGELMIAVTEHLLAHGGDAEALKMSARVPLERHANMSALGAALLGVPIALHEHDAGADRFDVVLGNPPFNTAAFVPTPQIIWPYGEPPARSNLGWLQLAVTALTERGRAAVLTSNISTSSSSSAARRIRAAMIDAGVIDAVIALPDRLFANTGIPVTLWMLRTPSSDGAAGILFIDASTLGELRHYRRTLTPDDIARIVARYHAWRARRDGAPSSDDEGFSAVRSQGRIAQEGYSLDPRRMVSRRRTGRARDVRQAELATTASALDRERAALLDANRDEQAQISRLLRRVDHPEPADVQRVSLGDVCTAAVGRSELHESERDDAVPVLVPRNIRRGSLQRTIITRSDRVDPALRLQNGDVVGTRVGGVGQFALVTDAHDGWLLGRGCFRLRPGDRVDPGYLYYLLRTSAIQEWINQRAGGSAVRNISMSEILKLPLALPPLHRQLEDSAVLSAVADAARRYDRIAEMTGTMAEAGAELLLARVLDAD